MTDQPTNPLLGRGRMASRAAYADVNGAQVPTDIDGYCAWLNARERRRGRWIVIEVEGRRSVDWRTEVATDEWLRDRGLVPKIGKAA